MYEYLLFAKRCARIQREKDASEKFTCLFIGKNVVCCSDIARHDNFFILPKRDAAALF